MAAGEYKRGDLYCNLYCSKIYFAKLKFTIDFGELILYNEYIKRAKGLEKIRSSKIMKLATETIEKLIAAGGNRWTKGNYDRIYFNASALGLRCEYYKTGNISGAWFNGEMCSNSCGRRLKAAKTYIDVATGEIVSTESMLREALTAIVEKIAADEEIIFAD